VISENVDFSVFYFGGIKNCASRSFLISSYTLQGVN
jgi:hypothetical protein